MSTPTPEPSTPQNNDGTVDLTPTDFDDAAQKLDQLFSDLDACQMYRTMFVDSVSDTRDQLGQIEDQYNVLKTDLGKLFDGSRQALRKASQSYAAADKIAAATFAPTSIVNGGQPQ
jgi:hypothetical protein